jgi:hypothetical protein
MSTENKWLGITIQASENYQSAHQHKAITAGGLVAASPDLCVGLLKTKPGVGEHATVGYIGIMRYYAGGAVTNGENLTVTTSGFIVATGSASGTTVGKAIEAANSGDLAKGMFNFANAGPLS